MKIRNLILLLLPLILSNCKGDLNPLNQAGETTVKGEVIDHTTGNRVPNIPIFIKARSENFCCGYNIEVRQEWADSEGKFDFSFDADKDLEYALKAYQPHGHYGSWGEEAIDKGRKNKNIELKVSPIAWVKFVLHDEPPLEIERVVYVRSFLPTDGQQSVHIYGIQDTTFIKSFFGNTDQTIIWGFKQNHQIVEKNIIPIHIPGLDTLVYTINY